jgi:hypothetical protein
MEIVPVDEEDGEELAEYSRLKCDPSISIADLEKALDRFFEAVGYRNVQEVMDIITEARCTWKTAPKARAYSYMSLGLTCL